MGRRLCRLMRNFVFNISLPFLCDYFMYGDYTPNRKGGNV